MSTTQKSFANWSKEKKKKQDDSEVSFADWSTAKRVDSDYINSFVSDANSLFDRKSFEKDGYNTWSQLNKRADNIKTWTKLNKSKLNDESYKAITDYLTAYDKASLRYSQWKTEDDYNDYLKGQEEREKMLSFDTKKGRADISDIDRQIASLESTLAQKKEFYNSRYSNNGNAVNYGPYNGNPGVVSPVNISQNQEMARMSQEIADYEKQLSDLEKQRTEKYTYYNQAKNLQSNKTLTENATNAEDFELYSEKGINNKITQTKDRFSDTDSFGEDATLTRNQRFAKYLTDDELNVYEYYIGKGDTQSAEAYLNSMEETVNGRKGLEIYDLVEDKTALELAFGVAAGLDQFGKGIKTSVGSLFGGKDYYAASAIQQASGLIREDLSDEGFKIGDNSLAQIGYDLVTTTSNMLPSILTSAVAGVAGNAIAPGVGTAVAPVIGSALLGASAAGNAYAEMINLGYDKGQARAYGAMVGASEAGLQLVLGGVGKLGGYATKGLTTKLVGSIDNALAKGAIKFGGKMVSEGFEEYMQEILDPFFKNVAFNEKNEVKLYTPEALYSGVLGALTAGVLDSGPSSVTNTVKTYAEGKKALDNGVEISRLKELGQTFSADSVAYKIADKVNKDTGAYTIGKLLNEVGAELTQQNQTEVANALVEKGVAPKNAESISKWLSQTVDGVKLTEFQAYVLENNEVVSDVFRDVIVDKNSTFNQRRQNFFETAKLDGYAGENVNTQTTDDALARYNAKYALSQEMTKDALSQTDTAQRLRTSAQPDFNMAVLNLANETVNKSKTATQQSAYMMYADPAVRVKASNATKIIGPQEHTVSAEGKTILNTKNGAEDVEIKGVALTKGKEMTLELADGRKVSSKDVEYSTEDEAIVYETVANMEVPTGVADVLIKGYSPKQSGSVYAFGVEQAYRYGYFNIPKAELTVKGTFARDITDAQRETAYNLGKAMGKADFKANKGKKSYSKGKVIFNGDRSQLTPIQNTSMDALEKVADITGLQIRIFESDMVDGKRKGKNGSYATGTSEMAIDLFAGADGQGIMLHTVSHELVHHVRQWSAEKYKILADFLMEQYGKKGVSVDALVRLQIEKAKASDRDIDYAEAHEEVIADSMEAMLTDGKVLEKLQMLQTKDKSLFEKIKSAITELVNKIKKAYKNVKPETLEGQIVASMLDEIETIQQLFVDAIADASENFKNAEVDNSKNTSENDKIKHSFAGREAKTSDIKTLEAAIRLEDVGKATSEEIRQETGWFRGMDGKWRFEISDRDIEIDTTGKFHTNPDVRRYKELFDKVFVNMNASEEETTELRGLDKSLKGVSFEPRTLGELIKHDKLFKAYPQLKEISVHFADIDERGIYDPISKILVLQSKLKIDKSKLEKTLIHEIQHAIQDIEGFTSGSSPDSWQVAGVSKEDAYSYYERTAGEIEARDSATRSWRTDEARKEKRPDIDRTDVVFADGGVSYNQEYEQAEVNKSIVSLIEKVKKHQYKDNAKVEFGIISEKAANEIKKISGIDVSGYKIVIEARQIYHILKDHGINGEADHSMSDDNDIAKMEVAFNTYDKISDGGRTKAYTYMKNGHNRTAPTILYEKEIGEKSYYVVQAVPETKKRTLYIVTAFIGKKGYKKEASQLINAKSLDVTAKTGSVVTSNNIISNSREIVKQKQLEIIEKVNPAPNSYLTWIRKVEDIKKLSETLEDSEWSDYDEFNPDLTRGMLEEAIEKGEITVYSSYQIKQGAFVSPSYMEAESYSGNGKVYEKTVKIDDVAWIDPTQGMYANIDEKYSDRDPDALTPRNLLANALEESAIHEVEKKKLAEYKDNIEKLYEKEQELYEVRKEIKKLSFTTGKRDTAKLKKLQEKAAKLSNNVTFYDKKLLNLENTKFLKNVLEREKSKAIKRQKEKDAELLQRQKEKALQKEKEITERYRESRKKSVESRNRTVMRNKIKRVVNELNQYLLNGTKDKHVMDNMKKVVAEALNILDMDTVGADERVEKYNQLIAEATDPDIIASLTETRDRIQGQGDNLNERLMSLKNAYADIINSTDPVISNAYDKVIEDKILSVAQSIEGTSLRNMSISQLEEVYDLYKMVLTNIRDSNKAFKAGKDETISELGYKVNSEVEGVTEQKYKISAFKDYISKFGWNELKPIYAFRMIGSDTFQRLFKNILRGQDTWYRDVEEGKNFQQQVKKKYGYNKWDFKKNYTFTAKNGNNFDLTLQQIMSLYAFSRREQALNHLVQGGIVFDRDVKVTEKVKGIPVSYKVNTTDAFNLSPEIIGEIIDNLTPEQKSFVEEMQSFLSDTMGEKGNEVSLAMYGIKLYKEKFYFPLKSSEYYMNFTADEAGEVKLKNSGFSKETIKKANNPIVLSDFMDVWANHVNEMSTYHAFVLPIEDFSRVYNYRTPTSETETTKSLKNTLNNAFGNGVNKYIRQLLVDINGGARSTLTSPTDKITSLAKKGAVMLSASVVIQQPSAIARAMAYVKPKYFVNAENFKFTKHNEKWEEVKKYAPVAGIKEMGYFDTGMGRSSADWIVEEDYNGIREKLYAFFYDKDARKTLSDDFLGKAPSMADELSWVSLWEAVKKETAKETELDPGTEEFLKRCGERFTEVVELTQVYDSVLSRSGYMRDKGSLMKMATAFMAEPTVQANMLIDAGIQGKRNGKAGLKVATGVVGAVVGSIIVNTLLKSIVYAARDDKEDETQFEKYFGAVVGDLAQSLNPLTMIPFVKDVVSIFSGYDVERMDMSLIADLKDSILAIGSETQPTSDKILGLTGSIGQLFGIPAKNVIRDAKAVINTVNSLSEGTQTTKTGIKFTLQDEVNSTITGNLLNKVFGVSFDTSNQKKYYDAVMEGDTVYAERIESSFKNPKNGIVESLKKYEPRILEAAQAEVNGKPNERYKIAKEIVADGFKQDYVVLAIQGKANQLTKKTSDNSNTKKESLSSIDNYFASAKNGETSTAKTHMDAIIETDMHNNGKTYEEAEKSFFDKFYDSVENAIKEEAITVDKASEMLEQFGNLDSESAQEKAQYYAFKRDYSGVEYDWKVETVAKYYTVAEPAGISVEIYDEYLVNAAKYTLKEQKLEVIDSLDLTDYQKDVLYSLRWKESTLWQAPWH